MTHQKQKITQEAVSLLQRLIETPSYSKQEDQTALLLEDWFKTNGIPFKRQQNNLWASNAHWEEGKPVLLLNSHHDTVYPNSGYTRDPFKADIEDGKLYGLGSNDAGGCLVSLLAAFTLLYQENLPYNLVFLASAEEETMSEGGIRSVLDKIPAPDVAIVGEPTLLQPAIAEKGLVIFDAWIKGTPGHAAHPNNDQAIYKLPEAINWLESFKFPKTSPLLGDVHITLTQVAAGSQHNVIPAEVKMVIDVRVNDCYSNQEIAEILTERAPFELKARSLRLTSSSISSEHHLVKTLKNMGRTPYGSPTLSDQTALSCPSMKLGPGDSLRSHTADEFIYISEIGDAIQLYCELIQTPWPGSEH